MTKFSEIIKQKELEQKNEMKQFIDKNFEEIFKQFPEYIQKNFFSSYKRYFKKDKFPFHNISSLNKRQYDFYTKHLDIFYSFVNILHFHEALDIFYCSSDIEIFLNINKLDTASERKDVHLVILRGLSYLLPTDIFVLNFKKYNLMDIIPDLKNIDYVKISASFTDDKYIFAERIDLIFNSYDF